MTYYAITTGATGKSLGQTQGFTRARWAFVIYDIQGGGDKSTQTGQLRNMYAAADSRLLFDGGGNFIGGADAPLAGITNPTNTSIKWSGPSQGSQIGAAFKKHYGNKLISMPEFTINNVDDNKATMLMWYLMSSPTDRQGCDGFASMWLPEIKFAPEDPPIITDKTQTPQRILNCGKTDLTGMAIKNLRDRYLKKLSQSISINETKNNRIFANCAKNGCPSTAGIFLTSSNRFSKRSPAAYSQLQISPIIMEELVRNLLTNPTGQKIAGLTKQDIHSLQLDRKKIAMAVQTAASRIRWTYTYADCMEGNIYGYAAAYSLKCPQVASKATMWGKLSQPDQLLFTQKTGLGKAAWNYAKNNATNTLISNKDYVRGTNKKELLDSLAWEAWRTETQAENWFINIVKSGGATGKFQVFSSAYLGYLSSQVAARMKYSNKVLYPLIYGGTTKQQAAIDKEMAARTARRQNGGNYFSSIKFLKKHDPNNYVKKMYGDIGYEKFGNFSAMRCAGNIQLGSRNGLWMTPLKLQ